MVTPCRGTWGELPATICKNWGSYIYCISQMRTPVMGGTWTSIESRIPYSVYSSRFSPQNHWRFDSVTGFCNWILFPFPFPFIPFFFSVPVYTWFSKDSVTVFRIRIYLEYTWNTLFDLSIIKWLYWHLLSIKMTSADTYYLLKWHQLTPIIH
jgi:hypothetical protein